MGEAGFGPADLASATGRFRRCLVRGPPARVLFVTIWCSAYAHSAQDILLWRVHANTFIMLAMCGATCMDKCASRSGEEMSVLAATVVDWICCLGSGGALVHHHGTAGSGSFPFDFYHTICTKCTQSAFLLLRAFNFACSGPVRRLSCRTYSMLEPDVCAS